MPWHSTHTCGCHGDVNVSSMLQKISVRMKHLRSVVHGPHRGYRCAPFCPPFPLLSLPPAPCLARTESGFRETTMCTNQFVPRRVWYQGTGWNPPSPRLPKPQLSPSVEVCISNKTTLNFFSVAPASRASQVSSLGSFSSARLPAASKILFRSDSFLFLFRNKLFETGYPRSD